MVFVDDRFDGGARWLMGEEAFKDGRHRIYPLLLMWK